MLIELVKDAWNVLRNRRPVGLQSSDPNRVSTTNRVRESNPMQSYLKVKIKSLAEESKIIRHEERRVKRSIHWWSEFQTTTGEDSNTKSSIDAYKNEYFGLHNHRTYEVRRESRASQLAYAYIQGYPYSRVEDPTKTRKAVPASQIAKLVTKYGTGLVPPNVPYSNRQHVGTKIIIAWSEGKTYTPTVVDGVKTS